MHSARLEPTTFDFSRDKIHVPNTASWTPGFKRDNTESEIKGPVAPVAYQVILEPGIGQFREFEPRRVYTRINSLGLFLCTN